MRNILLSLTLLSSLAFANELTTLQQIEETKAQIEALQANLKTLEASLPSQVEQEKAIALAEKEESERLKTHTEFGFISTKGNTDTLSYNVDAKLEKTIDRHEFTFIGDGEYASDSGTETKNKYFLEFNYGYGLDEKLFLEYIAGYKYDGFSGYDYQAYTGPGVKYKAIRSDIHNLDLGSALLLSQDKRESTESFRYTSYRAKIDYSWQIFKNLQFNETFTYRVDVSDFEEYFIYSKTGFSSKISDIFSVGINYKIDYVNRPEVGKKEMDRGLSANLIADF